MLLSSLDTLLLHSLHLTIFGASQLSCISARVIATHLFCVTSNRVNATITTERFCPTCIGLVQT